MVVKVVLNNKHFEIALAKSNLSQNSFAKQLGVSSGYLSQIVCHNRYASPQIRQKIQDVLGLSFDDLFIID